MSPYGSQKPIDTLDKWLRKKIKLRKRLLDDVIHQILYILQLKIF